MYEIDGKKANQYYELGQQKPFACMSLKPGLGDHYYQEHKTEIWKQGYIQCTNGKRAQIPRYYEKMMEAENPQSFVVYFIISYCYNSSTSTAFTSKYKITCLVHNSSVGIS